MGFDSDIGQYWGSNLFSFCVTKSGDLWACVGDGLDRKSLLRRSQDGSYSIAIMNGSVRFTEDRSGSARKGPGSVDLRRDRLARRHPSSRRRRGALSTEGQRIGARTRLHTLRQRKQRRWLVGSSTWHWNPNTILVLDDAARYAIGGAFWRRLPAQQGQRWPVELSARGWEVAATCRLVTKSEFPGGNGTALGTQVRRRREFAPISRQHSCRSCLCRVFSGIERSTSLSSRRREGRAASHGKPIGPASGIAQATSRGMTRRSGLHGRSRHCAAFRLRLKKTAQSCTIEGRMSCGLLRMTKN